MMAVVLEPDPIVFEADDVRLAVRAMTRLDRGAVFATWMRSAREHLKETPRQRRTVDWDTFQAFYPRLVESLLDAERVAVLYNPEAPSVPHAWACASSGALHWAYVPFPIRGRGIGRVAISVALGSYPERIDVTSSFAPLTPRFVFNPYLLRGSR